jgi:hypothetical protein
MPNWCTNTLLISGEYDEVQRLLETVEADKTSLSLKLNTMKNGIRMFFAISFIATSY